MPYQMRLHEVGVRHRRRLRHAVALYDGDAERVLDARLKFRRQRGSAEEADTERRQVARRDAGILRQPQAHRRDGEQDGDAVALHEVEKGVHLEPPHHHLRRAAADCAVHQHIHAVDVEQRQMREDDVVLAQRRLFVRAREELAGVGRQIGVREHDALGKPGRAGRVGEDGDVFHRIHV